MEEYYSVRIWQLKAEASAAEFEELLSSGFLEVQQWIPGVKHLRLVRANSETGRYLLITTFANREAYIYWKQVDDEASDYWERYAAVLMRWGQLCYLVDEYAGEVTLDIELGGGLMGRGV